MILAVDFGFGNVKWKTHQKRGIFRLMDRKTHIATVDEMIHAYPSVIQKILSWNKDIVVSVVAVGLPLQAWKDLQIVTALHDEIFYNVKDLDEIYVYPQAASFAFTHGDGLVIDFGHNTVIACLVVNGKIVYDRTYFRKGSVEIANEVENLIKHELNKVGKTLTSVELDEIVLKGKYQIGLDVIDISEQIKEIKQDYIKRTIAMVINDLKANAGIVMFDRVYLIGGLAQDIKIQSQKVKVEAVGDAIYANVDAFYQLAVLRVNLNTGGSYV